MRFELIKGTASLKGTCYFEFCKNADKKKPCWNEDAYYLEEEVFDFFHKVFAKVSDNYDYYAFCKLNLKELKNLKGELTKYESALGSFRSEADYARFFRKLATRAESDEEHDPVWQQMANDLTRVAVQLRGLVDECLRSREVLWVLGM